jgi:hypothetical protein
LSNKVKINKTAVFEYLQVLLTNINKCTDQEIVPKIADWMIENAQKEGLEIYKEEGETNAKVINTFLTS